MLWKWLSRGRTDPRRRGSDSEGENNRSCVGEGVPPRPLTRCRGRWRRRESELRDTDGRVRIRGGSSSSQALTDERRRPRRGLGAAVATGHAWRRAQILVLAAGTGGLRRWMAPGAAQQRGVLPQRQGQHDRNDSCSKHVDARRVQRQGAIRASQERPREIARLLTRPRRAGRLLRWNFASSVRKILRLRQPPRRRLRLGAAHTATGSGPDRERCLTEIAAWPATIGRRAIRERERTL
jgi:hypothetical protein